MLKQDFSLVPDEKKKIVGNSNLLNIITRHYEPGKKIERKKFNIFYCWLQGINEMPNVVEKCYEQLTKAALGYNIIFIDNNNYKSYIELPKIIVDKYIKNEMCVQHFTDILRVALLKKYGGLWTDATVYYTDYFINHPEIYDKDLFSLGRWVTYLCGTSQKNNIFYSILYELMLEYINIYGNFSIYFLFDAMYLAIYENNKIVSNMIEKCKNDLKKDVYYVSNKKNEVVNKIEFYSKVSNMFAHKLTYKEYIDVDKKDSTINFLFNNNLLYLDKFHIVNNANLKILSNIYYEKGSFSGEIDKIRNAIYKYDKDLIKKNHKQGIEKFNFSGNFTYKIDDIEFKCLLIDKGNSSLCVSYNGAKDVDKNSFGNRPPVFPRWSYYSIYKGSFLGIDDPMYDIYNNLTLGWYYGEKNRSFIRLSVELIKKICENKGIDKSNIVFFSSSGGGYASLYASSLLEDTLSISLNPQIYIQNHPLSKNFKKITNYDLNENDDLHRNQIDVLIRSSKSKHIIIINAASDKDFLDHLMPFAKNLGFENIRYGLNCNNNVLIWVYEAPGAPSAHNAFETKYLFASIDYIAHKFKNDESFNVDKYQDYCIMINEFWYDLYCKNNKIYELEHLVSQLKCSNEIIYLDSDSSLDINKFSFDRSFKDIKIKRSDSNYNFFSIHNFSNYNLYMIKIKNIYSDTCNNVTCGIFDFTNNKRIKYVFYDTLKDITFIFIIGKIDNSIGFCIYPGEAGKTADKNLLISSIDIYKADVKSL